MCNVILQKLFVHSYVHLRAVFITRSNDNLNIALDITCYKPPSSKAWVIS